LGTPETLRQPDTEFSELEISHDEEVRDIVFSLCMVEEQTEEKEREEGAEPEPVYSWKKQPPTQPELDLVKKVLSLLPL